MWRQITLVAVLTAISAPSFAQSNAADEWPKQIAARLSSVKRPFSKLGETGTVKVGFRLDPAGKPLSSWLVESSGVAEFDAEALAYVERAQPFPPPPADREDLQFTLPVVFAKRPASQVAPLPAEDDPAVKNKMNSVCRGC